jgi:hypothetical protein
LKAGHVVTIRGPDVGDRTLGSVWSRESGQPKDRAMALCLWGSINTFWPGLGSYSWHFDIVDILVSLSKLLPPIFILTSSSK